MVLWQINLENKVGKTRNEVNMVNNGGNNCAKSSAEMISPGGHCESGFSGCLSSRTTNYSEKRATYNQLKGKVSKLQNIVAKWREPKIKETRKKNGIQQNA